VTGKDSKPKKRKERIDENKPKLLCFNSATLLLSKKGKERKGGKKHERKEKGKEGRQRWEEFY